MSSWTTVEAIIINTEDEVQHHLYKQNRSFECSYRLSLNNTPTQGPVGPFSFQRQERRKNMVINAGTNNNLSREEEYNDGWGEQ